MLCVYALGTMLEGLGVLHLHERNNPLQCHMIEPCLSKMDTHAKISPLLIERAEVANHLR